MTQKKNLEGVGSFSVPEIKGVGVKFRAENVDSCPQPLLLNKVDRVQHLPTLMGGPVEVKKKSLEWGSTEGLKFPLASVLRSCSGISYFEKMLLLSSMTLEITHLVRRVPSKKSR